MYQRDSEVLSLLWRIDESRRSIQAVTGDLAPLCDQHHAPMCHSKTIPRTFQGCTGDQLCGRRYHPLIGITQACSLRRLTSFTALRTSTARYTCAPMMLTSLKPICLPGAGLREHD